MTAFVTIQLRKNFHEQLRKENKLVAGLLCWFLGTFGAHRFYLGYKGKARAQLMAPILMIAAAILADVLGSRTVVNPALLAAASVYYAAICIWVFVDFIRILLNKLLPADGQDYIHMEGPLAQSAEELPESFVAADSGVVMIDQLFALYKKGAITAAQYTAKLTEFRSRM